MENMEEDITRITEDPGRDGGDSDSEGGIVLQQEIMQPKADTGKVEQTEQRFIQTKADATVRRVGKFPNILPGAYVKN
jgi:hypothetical protein